MEEVETAPDIFIRYDYPRLLDENRQAVAGFLRVPVETVVFVPNATTALNAVLRNFEWNADGKDEILYFSTIYGACGKTVDYVVDTRRGMVNSRPISITYPCEDDEIINLFEKAVATSKGEGKRPRLCIYDVVSSLPGLRFPFEAMTSKCKELGVMTVIDGAQGIGMVDSRLDELDPDFWFSNCHKWLHIPRACAVLYVPVRNQHMMASTVPTSHGYVRKSLRNSTSGTGSKSAFVSNFQYTGTLDFSPYLCVKEALAWRNDVVGGEDILQEYNINLAKTGGRRVAEILGTEVLDNKAGTASDCAMTNVRLPIRIAKNGSNSSAAEDESVLTEDIVNDVAQWMMDTLVRDYKTFIVVYSHGQHVYVRLSAQVYLELQDFEWAAETLLELCARVAKREYEGHI
ncbi:uncharacterized protein E0L32_007667 [Thyridium curvatum]|uniref:Aminotransferase class V domain-containing protein n=1 Tax=Thyridium curvatum TaxID=1093900 RepID=A0A507B496_9PEZI|nr:uncharacterized protein E0L32_007667 [Thyridium curvatum]TPX11688.1 hypothetical protein E0L32_007667 [Thyridium curvatum]